jgi:hypothetical protein
MAEASVNGSQAGFGASRLLALVGLVALLGCAPSGTALKGPKRTAKAEPAYSLDEELESELRHVPTDFVVPIPENRYAWERAQLFFKEQTSGGKFVAGRGDSVVLSNAGSGDRVTYNVEKQTTATGGSRFVFSCAAGSAPVPTEILSVQCRNLARFVQQGILEKSLIIR